MAEGSSREVVCKPENESVTKSFDEIMDLSIFIIVFTSVIYVIYPNKSSKII